jgi:hypothetical protein
MRRGRPECNKVGKIYQPKRICYSFKLRQVETGIYNIGGRRLFHYNFGNFWGFVNKIYGNFYALEQKKEGSGSVISGSFKNTSRTVSERPLQVV